MAVEDHLLYDEYMDKLRIYIERKDQRKELERQGVQADDARAIKARKLEEAALQELSKVGDEV